MKEHKNEKNNYQAVDEKPTSFQGIKAEKLVAKRGIRISRDGTVFSVSEGDDVSGLPPEKLELLKSHGVI